MIKIKAIFNDATELSVQQAIPEGDYLRILSLEAPETLRQYFEDPLKTKRIVIQERGQTIAMYDDYTTLYRIEWSPGGIYTVVMYKPEKTPEVQTEVQQAAILVAQMQAQALTDEQALTVKALYKDWEKDPEGYPYKMSNPGDKRRNYNGKLWNLNKDHKKQADWYPGADPTLWTEIVEGHAGTQEDPIPVPDSVTTSGYEYEYGKYYSEGGAVYLMDRQGMDAGDKITQYFAPSALIGQYFSMAE